MTDVANPEGRHRPKRLHHGEGSVCKRTDHWRARPWAAIVPYRDESGRRREMWWSAASRAEADEIRKRELRKLGKGIVPTAETVGEYVNGWLSGIEVGPGTWPTYHAHVTRRIIPTLGAVPLDRLTPAQVRGATIRWQGAPATRAGTLRLLRAAMRQAVADRRIEHDPTAGIPYPKAARREPVTLSGPQARQLIAAAGQHRFAPILVVSLGLGVRRGEALGLRVQDVNLQTRTATIARSLRYIAPALRTPEEGPYRMTGTKTGETRVVPLPGFVAEALRDRLAERERERKAAKVWAANDNVFCTPAGNTVPIETLRTWFLATLERAGLPAVRWHSLRATTITLLYEMDVPEVIIMAIAGHRDLATTRMYKGRTPKAMQRAADRMDEVLG